MRSAYLYKSSLVIKIALGTAILLIAYITNVFFSQMQNLGNSVDSISVSNSRMLELEKVLTAISINESSVRSFLATGDSTYVTKRFHPFETIRPSFQKLRRSAHSGTGKHLNVDTLHQLVARRYEMFQDVLNTVPKTKDQVQLRATLIKGDSLTDRIRGYISRSMSREVANVDIYRINHKYEVETSIITSFLLVTLALFVILISLNRIQSDLRNLKKLNDELRFLNFTFNNAEKIAGISHWKYNLQTKSYIFSDNFFNLLGVDPDELEPNLENVLPFIHPADRDLVVETYTNSLQQKTPTSLIYRLHSKNGSMRYIRSVGSFAENSNGELVKIGVNYDITEHYKNTKELEENNQHLREANAELESFNNIVSHDLQEPLRKIQLFVSRIREDEMEKLSDKGREFFEKIGVSANRMQSLLMDLVSYSRTMKHSKTFEPCNLLEIVEDVVRELDPMIKASGANVIPEELPTVKGVSYQLHQLFSNLISNAIKFAGNRKPEIRIKQLEIAGSEVHDGRSFDSERFVKIMVSDNGIGFKQEFADKIFLLFRRLDQDMYQGTGIGLAICRKIVENHSGCIYAQGIPGKGADFIFYLKK